MFATPSTNIGGAFSTLFEDEDVILLRSFGTLQTYIIFFFPCDLSIIYFYSRPIAGVKSSGINIASLLTQFLPFIDINAVL